MAVSSFSRRQLVTALVAALALTALSWAYFAGLWQGVVVTGAGEVDANGYYKWEPTERAYVKSSLEARKDWRSRVPNVYDLVSRGPEFRRDAGPLFFIRSQDNLQKPDAPRVWLLMKSTGVYYRSKEIISPLENTPPSTGWAPVGRSGERAAEPGPEVRQCGRKVAPDPDPADLLDGNWGRRGKGNSPLQLGKGPAEVVKYPGTVLLLGINLAFAYHLWAKRVSPEAVAVSYALFWEEREYWRLFTASFSHFEPLHLLFNAMGTWNTRELERLLGTFRYLYLSLDLVVTTIMLLMLIKHALVKWRGLESQREGRAVGFSCVLFAYMTYLAVAMRQFCPVGDALSALCSETWRIPLFWGLPSLPVNLGPFASLALAQFIMPRAAFLGHLSGILMGYLMAWGFLGGVSTPILAGVSAVFMLQHSRAWARMMPDFSLLLLSWSGGDAGRVARARRMGVVFAAHVCLTVAFLFVFTWGSAVGEVLALVVGFNALQALKCCCCPDSLPAEHRYCVTLLKAYGALSAILLVSDLLSLGAILGQSCFVEWLGVSESARKGGLVLLVLAAAVHGLAVAACIDGGVVFRDGQTFLSSIGLKQVVTAYSRGLDAVESAPGASVTPSFVAAGGITSGRLYRGGGRVLGTAASNRTPPASVDAASAEASSRGRGGAGAGGSGVAGSSRRTARPPARGRGSATALAEEEAGAPLLRKGGVEGGVGDAGALPREVDL